MSPTGHYTSLSSYTSVLPTCCLSYLSFSAEGLHRSNTCPLRRPFRRMVCTGHYLLALFGGWSAELPYLSFSVRGLQYISPTCPGSPTFLPSRGLVYTGLTHGLHLHISPTSFCPFRRRVCTYFWRMVCTGSPTCPFGGWSADHPYVFFFSPLLPVVHPQPIVSTRQHCVHHSSCPTGPSPWWRCTQ